MTFIEERNKILDMILLSKDDFLKSYTYLKESEYEDTKKEIVYILFEKEIHEKIVYTEDGFDFAVKKLQEIKKSNEDGGIKTDFMIRLSEFIQDEIKQEIN